MRKLLVAIVTASMITSQAVAGAALMPQPYQVGEETARFQKGVATVTLEQKNGAVQITPVVMDHGAVSFMVVVYNDSDVPADFDSTSVIAEAGPVRLAAQTADQLESSAKNRAMWSTIGVALLAGAAAAAASQASTTNTYRSRLYTPRGTYSFVSSYRDNSAAVLGVAAAGAAGAAGISSIQGRLDATLAEIGENVIQRTTVDPGESYGGRIVLQKIKDKKASRDLVVSVAWNGEVYKFGLHIPAKGDAAITPVRSASAPSRAARAAEAASPVVPAPMTGVTPVATPAPAKPSQAPSIINAATLVPTS